MLQRSCGSLRSILLSMRCSTDSPAGFTSSRIYFKCSVLEQAIVNFNWRFGNHTSAPSFATCTIGANWRIRADPTFKKYMCERVNPDSESVEQRMLNRIEHKLPQLRELPSDHGVLRYLPESVKKTLNYSPPTRRFGGVGFARAWERGYRRMSCRNEYIPNLFPTMHLQGKKYLQWVESTSLIPVQQ
jgi:hypothetical protein